MTVFTRRMILRSFAATSALPVLSAPMIARAAEIELRYGNNLPLSHPLNIRAQEADTAQGNHDTTPEPLATTVTKSA